MSIAQLRRIDQEITEHRQQIAMHQVEIARLQDARLVLAGLAERDQTGAGSVEPPLLAGAQGPLLVVRKAHSDSEEGPAVKQPWNKGRKLVVSRRDQTQFREKIMELFKEQPAMEAGTVIKAMHPNGDATKKMKARVYNALLALKKDGRLQQTEMGEPYMLAPVKQAAA